MRIAPLLLSAAIACPAAAQTPSPAAVLDTFIANGAARWHVPGLAVVVVKDGRIAFAKGYGVRELGKPGAVDTATLFAAASTTKAMTAAALGMLVDEGKLKWDDPVTKYLPSFQLSDPYVTREVTVRDLLTHRAGLGNADYLWYESGLSREEVVRRARWVKPAYSFRSSFIYQNVMYAVAGQVVAEVSGMSWDDFIRTRIFQPLGMTRSVTTLAQASMRENVVSPHNAWGPTWDTVRVIRNAAVDAAAPAGSIWTSVADWSKWLRFLLDSGRVNGMQLLKPATVNELFKPVTMVTSGQFYPTQQLTKPHWMTYGLGWFQQDYQGRKLDFHTGSIDGLVALAGLVRDQDFGVYILENLDHAELRHAIMLEALDLWLGAPQTGARDWNGQVFNLYKGLRAGGDSAQRAADAKRATGTKPSLSLERYSGTYSDSLYGTVTVSSANGALRLKWNQQSASLSHWEYDTFRADWDDRWKGNDQVTFVLGSGGTPKEVEVSGLRFARTNR